MTTIEKKEDTIVLEIDIAAPPERVFQALTTPEELLEWWGDDDVYRSDVWEVDLEVGGRYRSAGKNADGRPFSVEGEFLEIDPPRRLSYTWNPSWGEMGNATTVTFELAPTDAGTHVKVTHSGFAGHPEAMEGHSQGWPLVLGWLREFSEAKAA